MIAMRSRSARVRAAVWRAGVLLLAMVPLEWAAAAEHDSSRWEGAIQSFEKRDQQEPPREGGIVFVGSSSIVRWDLEKSFPGVGAINRGFGGSQLADSVAFAERVVIAYRPRLVLLYAGDNDLAQGKEPEQVFADYQAFVGKVHAALPEARIVYLAVKPSIKRWSIVDKGRAVNEMIAQFARGDQRLEFADVAGPMLGEDGRPRTELFVTDGLHLSAAGYELWSRIVAPYLEQAGSRGRAAAPGSK